MTNEKAVAEKLLEIQAIKLNLEKPFTWASGWKSPIYCDNRKTLSFPHIREFIKSEMCNLKSPTLSPIKFEMYDNSASFSLHEESPQYNETPTASLPIALPNNPFIYPRQGS